MKHIEILKPKDCSGCGACAQICPQKCINMIPDSGGFKYPSVNTDLCVECGACRKVCPFISHVSDGMITDIYAAVNKNVENRLLSSSGGVFHCLGHQIISEGGLVFGAKFNEDWSVSHGVAETEQELMMLTGSKYVQSEINDSYSRCEQFLRSGRKVLFSGTPCQIAGLNKYLKKKYADLLTTVEVICHGVPSPEVWKAYLDYFYPQKNIIRISFRTKTPSWEKFSMKINFSDSVYLKPADQDPYMFGFLRNIYLRPSCYSCKTKGGNSGADLTLGDFWGIDDIFPEINDHMGVSLIICHNETASMQIKKLGLELNAVDVSSALRNNKAYLLSVERPYQSYIFWKKYLRKGISCLEDIVSSYSPTLKNRIINKIYTCIIYRK